MRECEVCQRYKPKNVAYPGYIQPLPIPHTIFSKVSMDFIVVLPKSKGKQILMVVVDKPSKYAHFVALSHPYIAQSVAQTFIDCIYKLHG